MDTLKTTFKNNPLLWVYFFVILFILGNAYLIPIENYYLMLLPFALAMVVAVFSSFKFIFYLNLICVPLSLPLKEFVYGLSFDVQLPTDLLMLSMLALLIIKSIKKAPFHLNFLKHPISIVIICHLLWLFITSLTSTMPIVSFKFLLVRLWFVTTFYFICKQYISKIKQFKNFIYCYLIPFLIVIAYSLNKHLSKGIWDKQMAYESVNPFYNDHTIYGAVLAMLIPISIGLIYIERNNYLKKTALIISTIVLFIAVFFSYSRAAWLSLVLISIPFLILYFRIKLKTLLIISLSCIAILFTSKDLIVQKIEKNKTDSSTDISKHITSMSNVQTDASNLERINRWACANKMFQAKPYLGFGPGTYMFQYAPFQMYSNRTIISTNFGEGGTAHSEYLGPLAEQGFIGMLLFILMMGTSLYFGIKMIKKSKGDQKILLYGVTLGLGTYFIHGFLNNFLDSDKASCLFWAYFAFIVTCDLNAKNSIELNSEHCNIVKN